MTTTLARPTTQPALPLFDVRPPTVDIKADILSEHHRAELERLAAGFEGCGCLAVCQPFYQTLSLAQYGKRVFSHKGTVVITAGRTGATEYGKYEPRQPLAIPLEDATMALQPSEDENSNKAVEKKPPEPKPAKVKSSAKHGKTLQAKNRRGK